MDDTKEWVKLNADEAIAQLHWLKIRSDRVYLVRDCVHLARIQTAMRIIHEETNKIKKHADVEQSRRRPRSAPA